MTLRASARGSYLKALPQQNQIMPSISKICQESIHKVPKPRLGQQVAVDTTLVSPLTREGDPRPKADWKNGVALEEARKDKEADGRRRRTTSWTDWPRHVHVTLSKL